VTSDGVTYMTLLWRDNLTCHICERGLRDEDPFDVEHIVPKLRGRRGGGSDDLGNLALAHLSCNAAKGTKAISAYLSAKELP